MSVLNKGAYSKFGGTINLETSWGFLEATESEIRGGYTAQWTNNTDSDITVSVVRFVFDDADGIQIAEDVLWERDEFDLDAGANRARSGNFSLFTSVSAANQIVAMGVWSSFEER